MFRRCLARVRRNMCALPKDSLEAMATLFFSSRKRRHHQHKSDLQLEY